MKVRNEKMIAVSISSLCIWMFVVWDKTVTKKNKK